ncbi:MAG: amino acid ABC transporter substrate-binding protein [Bradyrhizobium sp.]|jgi:branched-chain amino acid transport system substrate-binding protein
MSINRRQIIKATGAGSALAILGSRDVFAQAQNVITFGGSIPMSGKEGDTGLNVLQGYKVAMQFINEKLGGVRIGDTKYTLDLQMFDDASDPQRATTLIQKQVDAGIDFFLGSFSSAIVLPAAAITERAKKPTVQAGGGSDQIFTKKFRYMFGMFPRASRQLASLTEMLKSMGGQVKTCSLITTNDPYSKTQADGAAVLLKEAGIEVLDVFRLPPSATDVSGVINDLRARTPDALICNTHQQESALITQQLVSTGTEVKLLFATLGPQLATFRSNLGKYVEGMTFLQYWEPRFKFSDPLFGSSQEYYKYYTSVTDRKESYQTVAASACIVSYVKAMQDAGSVNPEKVRDALAVLDYESMYGRVKFTLDGDGDPVLMGPAIGQIQKSDLEVVFPEKIGTAMLVFPNPSWSSR